MLIAVVAGRAGSVATPESPRRLGVDKRAYKTDNECIQRDTSSTIPGHLNDDLLVDKLFKLFKLFKLVKLNF